MLLNEKAEKTFFFEETGQKTKQMYRGEFTVKCVLTLDEQIGIAVATDRYNGGSTTIAPAYALMNRAIAELETRIIEAPKFWKESDGGRKLLDSNILYGVYQKALDAEKAWTEDMKKKAEQMEKDAESNLNKKETAANG